MDGSRRLIWIPLTILFLLMQLRGMNAQPFGATSDQSYFVILENPKQSHPAYTRTEKSSNSSLSNQNEDGDLTKGLTGHNERTISFQGKELSIENLPKTTFPLKTSNDLFMDPCKAVSFDGDIALSQNEVNNLRPAIRNKRLKTKRGQKNSERSRRAATARSERVWDYAVIPYEIDANYSGVHKALFKQAMRHWENYTCVQFVERTDEHPNWIVFTERPCGCCSFVGKRGNGPQAISIGKNCDKFGIVVHELGHVVGFWHEHTRPDRDDWVTIIRENIMVGQEYNFNRLTEEEVNSMGLKYDYDSIMHYARNTFSKVTYVDTILPRDDLPENIKEMPEIGQRVRLSKGDIAQTMALYGCPVCGRTYQETAVSFGSPQHASVYTGSPGAVQQPFRMGHTCEWRILATHGEKIILNVTEMDIPASSGCHTDFLEIRDGYWHKSELIVRLCGKQAPVEPIVSSGSRMLLMYKTSEYSLPSTGFLATYEAVCGGELDMESGQLESPNYPADYQPNKECIWRVTVPKGFQVALKFQSFEIENHDNCVYDYIEVRDGSDEAAPKIGSFCGYKMPDDIKSTGNQLWIKFVSDSTVQKAGFAASFMKEYDECANPREHGCEHDCINTLGGYQCQCMIGYELHSDEKRCEHACGGLVDSNNGTITSPSFPDLYPANKNCTWEILAPPQWKITINFTHFDIEGNNQDCEYDSLSLSSRMGSGEIRRHGIFCGSRLPPVITSEGNSLRLEFASDNSVQKIGFAAIFFTDMDECAVNNGGCQHNCRNTIGSYYCSCHQGFVLHDNGRDCKEGGCKHEINGPGAEVTSPHFPDDYPAKKDCVWIFTTTAGHRIKLVFDEFEMEPHQECAYDHVIMFDGHTTEDQVLGRFCGSKLPHPIMATDDKMLMVFKSDASVQRKGFKAKYHSVCGGHLEAANTPKHIYSHAKYGDTNYDNREDCDWIIEAPQGKNVLLRFHAFELEDEQDCGYDFIEVFSGFDDTGPSYGRFCGNKIPPEIISVDEALLLRFKSDDTLNSKGFSSVYVVVDEAANFDDYEASRALDPAHHGSAKSKPAVPVARTPSHLTPLTVTLQGHLSLLSPSSSLTPKQPRVGKFGLGATSGNPADSDSFSRHFLQ